jgi:uncharacterized protein (DUF3084 family)
MSPTAASFGGALQEELELAAAELDAVQARLMALEAEKHSLQSKLETNRQDAAAVQVTPYRMRTPVL